MNIPVSNLHEPAPSRLLRRVDSIFVDGLKLRLIQDPSGPGVPPLVVACKDIARKELFQERHQDVYNYEVLGGLHGAKARQALLEEYPEEKNYARVYCIVYCGLTDEEALRLASRHNINGHYNHKMTHRDYVSIILKTCTCTINYVISSHMQLEACRSRLYVMSGKDETCDETPLLNLDWKRACSSCILPPVRTALCTRA